MTWKHVSLVAFGAALAVVGALTKASELYALAMGVITGAMGHAGSGGRITDRLPPSPPPGGSGGVT